jgi:hypothetical protein
MEIWLVLGAWLASLLVTWKVGYIDGYYTAGEDHAPSEQGR